MAIAEVTPKLLLERKKIEENWSWLLANISSRPSLSTGQCFVDDHKLWGKEGDLLQPLLSADDFVVKIAELFLTSQLGDIFQIVDLSNGVDSFDLFLTTQALDPDIKVFIESERRFREGLSEHLGFWATLATLVKLGIFTRHAISQPNFKADDKGPDGLFFGLNENQEPYIELRSIKSSIDNPYYLVASASFREGGNAERDKQLEEFYLLVQEEFGFGRLDRLLAQVSNSLSLESNQLIRAALLRTSTNYNAIVVASESFYTPDMFNGFQRVSSMPEKCIATYISSDAWTDFAEQVRNKVISILKDCGAW